MFREERETVPEPSDFTVGPDVWMTIDTQKAHQRTTVSTCVHSSRETRIRTSASYDHEL